MLNHLSLQSQNLDLYGMRGNPMTLGQNPGAQTDLKLHVSLPGLTSQGNLTTPLGELRGNYGANLRNLEAPNVGISSATDIELVGLGWEGKKSYTWVQTGIDVDARFHLDKDLVLFGFYGMTDGTNAINPNFVGDFSATGMSMSAMGRLALGHQRVLNDQLRLGASVQVNRLLGGLQWEVEDWAMRSQWDTINQTNSLTWSSDMQVSAFGLIADGAQLDSAMDFPRYLIMGMVPAYWSMLRAQKNSYFHFNTHGLGYGYSDVPRRQDRKGFKFPCPELEFELYVRRVHNGLFPARHGDLGLLLDPFAGPGTQRFLH